MRHSCAKRLWWLMVVCVHVVDRQIGVRPLRFYCRTRARRDALYMQRRPQLGDAETAGRNLQRHVARRSRCPKDRVLGLLGQRRDTFQPLGSMRSRPWLAPHGGCGGHRVRQV